MSKQHEGWIEVSSKVGTGSKAPDIREVHWQDIDLRVTNLVMAEGISGLELADRILTRQPGLRVVFAGGCAANEVSARFLEKNNAHFLHKPYTRTTLARAVRRVLDNVGPGQITGSAQKLNAGDGSEG